VVLFGVTNLVVDSFSVYFMKNRFMYAKAKYDETVDMSEVEHKVVIIQRAFRRHKFQKTHSTKEMKIFDIVQDMKPIRAKGHNRCPSNVDTPCNIHITTGPLEDHETQLRMQSENRMKEIEKTIQDKGEILTPEQIAQRESAKAEKQQRAKDWLANPPPPTTAVRFDKAIRSVYGVEDDTNTVITEKTDFDSEEEWDRIEQDSDHDRNVRRTKRKGHSRQNSKDRIQRGHSRQNSASSIE